MTVPRYGRALAVAALALLAAPLTAAPTRYAGADVGSKGIRGVVIEFDPDVKNGPVKVLRQVETNPTVGFLDKDGAFIPEVVAEAADDLVKLVDVFVKEENVPRDRIALVGSSALVTVPNRDVLVKAVEDRTKLKMTFLPTAEEEVRLTIDGVGVLTGTPWAALLDFGGGNAKGGVYTPAGFEAFGVPYGPVRFAKLAQEAVDAKAYPSFSAAVAGLRASELVPAIRARVKGKAFYGGQTTVALTGGLSYAVATLVHPARAQEPTVALTLADVETLVARLGKDKPTKPAVDLTGITDPAVLKKAQDDIKRVERLYGPDNLLAGATVFLELGAELQLKGKPLTFVRDVQHAWIIGYLARRGPPPLPQRPMSDPPEPVFPPPSEPAPPRPVPEPVPLGVPYYLTPTGGYVLASPPRPAGYLAPYPFPTTAGRYSWDNPGNFSGPGAYRYYGYARPVHPR